ncbi:MAG: glycosyltransferase [Desulfovibrionaceae bacterium]|mgnify:CR=1 FL=1|nr:glycosyltransferase [Desulfovibrionaceae bacterium]
MRILNLDGPFLIDGLQAHGHDVLSAGISARCDMVIRHPRRAMAVYKHACATGFRPDMVLYCDSGNLPYFPGVEELPCPTAFYSIDTYCNTWHFGYAHAFDAVFVAQKEHTPLFTAEGHRALWLPLFAKAAQDICRNEERDIPVAFVGTLSPKNIPDRKPFLESFRKAHPLFVATGAYVDIFNRAHIVLNQTAASEVNFRCFEAMACGAALLMEHSLHGLEDLFIPGEHILPLYERGNVREAVAIATAALADPDGLAALARRGQELVARRHTDRHRAKTLLNVMEPLLREKAHRRRLADLPRRRLLLAAAYGMLAEGLTAPHLRQHAAYFLNLARRLASRSGNASS